MSRERAAQLIDAGIWLKLSGDLDGARRLFERALKLDPQNTKASELLAAPGGPATLNEPPAIVGADNPFERPSSPGLMVAEGDWGSAAGFDVPATPAAPAADLFSDWGKATGVLPTPAPQRAPADAQPGRTAMMVAQAATPSTEARGSGLRTTGTQFASADSQARPSTQSGLRSPSPVPQPARQTMGFTSPSQPGSTPSRSTLSFSGPTAGPLPPSEVPVVKPVVIHLAQAEEAITIDIDTEDDPVVEMLRLQVNNTPKKAVPSADPLQPAATTSQGNPFPPAPPSSAPDPTGSFRVDRSPSSAPTAAPAPPSFSDERPVAPAARLDVDAWNWPSPPPPEPLGESAQAPRASPALVPQASSAWDQRSNPGIKIDDILAPDRTLEFVSSSSRITRSPESKREEIGSLLRGARDLIDLDDHTGAMELIHKAQAVAPDDLEVRSLRERSEHTLLAMFESKLGHLEKTPRVMLKDDEIIWLNLDHRAGFVLAQIDGSVTFEDLFAVSGMSRLDTARILAQLVDEGVISRA
jgi:hypothetical protein